MTTEPRKKSRPVDTLVKRTNALLEKAQNPVEDGYLSHVAPNNSSGGAWISVSQDSLRKLVELAEAGLESQDTVLINDHGEISRINREVLLTWLRKVKREIGTLFLPTPKGLRLGSIAVHIKDLNTSNDAEMAIDLIKVREKQP